MYYLINFLVSLLSYQLEYVSEYFRNVQNNCLKKNGTRLFNFIFYKYRNTLAKKLT